jgi:hypothetical protein
VFFSLCIGPVHVECRSCGVDVSSGSDTAHDGSLTLPYKTIGKALNDTSCDVVRVKEGLYSGDGNVDLHITGTTRPSLHIEGENDDLSSMVVRNNLAGSLRT